MKTTVERLRQIIQEEVDAYVLYQEKLRSKEDKADKKFLNNYDLFLQDLQAKHEQNI